MFSLGIPQEHAMSDDFPLHFPPEFVSHCKRNNITADFFRKALTVPRYLRIRPQLLSQLEDSHVEGPIEGKVLWCLKQHSSISEASFVDWLPVPHYVSINRAFEKVAECTNEISTACETPNLAQHPCVIRGSVVPMDAASVATVVALAPRPGDNVLDLCCAPGMKLLLLSDNAASVESGVGCAIGVDISLHRVYTTRNILKKNNAQRCRMYLADGTKFTVKEASALRALDDRATNQRLRACGKLLHDDLEGKVKHHKTETNEIICYSVLEEGSTNPVALAYECPLLPPLPESLTFDRILVDAECTHDGSIHHMIGHNARSVDALHGFEANSSDSTRMDALLNLQRSLLRHAVSIVKQNGGIIVYSTCSFDTNQNEEVVKAVMNEHPQGYITLLDPFEAFNDEDVCFDRDIPAPFLRLSATQIDRIGKTVSKILPKCILLDPIRTNTSVQFIAKLLINATKH